MMMDNNNILLEMKNIYKTYGHVQANDDVSIRLKKGDILAIIGENGAGKSTLMKILYGLEKQDHGDIFIQGEHVQINKPVDALGLGIGMLQQHFMLFESLTVAENIVYNKEHRKGIFYDRKKNNQIVRELSERYQLKVDPEEIISNYPVGLQQRVEILKILYQNPEIIIFDEPSGILTPLEVEELLKNMKALKALGKTIILITHKLREVLKVADHVVVMRSGRVVYETNIDNTNEDELSFQIVGHKLEDQEIKKSTPGDKLLEVENLVLRDERGKTILDHMSFHVNRGEIVGIAGVSGNGQSELVRCITGLLKSNSGSIRLNHQEIANHLVNDIRNAGLSHIPEDRFLWGSAARANLMENAIMGFENVLPISKHGIFNFNEIKKHTNHLIDTYNIKTGTLNQSIRELSGGNMQKMIVAREMTKDTPFIVANEPTRGIDIGAMSFIHAQLIKKRDQGHGILLVSSELSEIMALSDRIYIIYEGSIQGEFQRNTMDAIDLGKLMVGGRLNGQKNNN
jgi:general nucleoside transport system ATP-binding protein